jgi:hypothetical protein
MKRLDAPIVPQRLPHSISRVELWNRKLGSARPKMVCTSPTPWPTKTFSGKQRHFFLLTLRSLGASRNVGGEDRDSNGS